MKRLARKVIIVLFKALLIFAFIVGGVFTYLYSLSHHEKRPTSTCISNLKQIGLAMMQYTQDYDNKFPMRSAKEEDSNVSWRKLISPYVKSNDTYQCPDNPVKNIPDLEKDGFNRSYAVNCTSPTHDTLGGPFADRKKAILIDTISKPSFVIMITETTAAFNDFNVLNAAVFTSPTNAALDTGHLFAGHMGNTNILFADGHVKQFKPLDTLSSGVNMWSIDGKPFSSNDNETAKRVIDYAVKADKN